MWRYFIMVLRLLPSTFNPHFYSIYSVACEALDALEKNTNKCVLLADRLRGGRVNSGDRLVYDRRGLVMHFRPGERGNTNLVGLVRFYDIGSSNGYLIINYGGISDIKHVESKVVELTPSQLRAVSNGRLRGSGVPPSSPDRGA